MQDGFRSEILSRESICFTRSLWMSWMIWNFSCLLTAVYKTLLGRGDPVLMSVLSLYLSNLSPGVCSGIIDGGTVDVV